MFLINFPIHIHFDSDQNRETKTGKESEHNQCHSNQSNPDSGFDPIRTDEENDTEEGDNDDRNALTYSKM